MQQKIMPCIWFDKDAEAAMNFYVSVFSAQSAPAPHRSSASSAIPTKPRRFMKGMKQVLTGIFRSPVTLHVLTAARSSSSPRCPFS